MTKALIAVVVVIAVVLLIVLVAFGQYVGVKNTLVSKNEAVKAAWSQVDIVLQRRADLIPNLVETVKGYAQQEQTVFGDIAKARSALLSAGSPQEKIAANGQLDGALGRLLLIVENYPQLKSNENFLRLQDELAAQRIALQSSANVITILCGITTRMCSSFPTVSLRVLRDSNRTKLISKLHRDHAKFRK